MYNDPIAINKPYTSHAQHSDSKEPRLLHILPFSDSPLGHCASARSNSAESLDARLLSVHTQACDPAAKALGMFWNLGSDRIIHTINLQGMHCLNGDSCEAWFAMKHAVPTGLYNVRCFNV